MRENFNPERFMASVAVDQNNLTEGMANNSALLAYYGMQAANWRATFDNFKLQIEVRSSEIALDLKNSGTKVSQGTADETVACHDDIKKLKRAQLVAKEQLDLYMHAMNAIEDRGRMLGSIGAWKRQEMNSLHSGGIVKNDDVTRAYYGGASIAPTASFVSSHTTAAAKLSVEEREKIIAKLTTTVRKV